jgi:hypothetical protein
MSITDYIVDIALILVIFRQIRTRELTPRNAILPMAIIAWAGWHYLRGFTVGGNDLTLIAVFTAAGIALGSWSGLATGIWRGPDGAVLARAGLAAAATWIAGMGFWKLTTDHPASASTTSTTFHRTSKQAQEARS